jgi:hypothetical protein
LDSALFAGGILDRGLFPTTPDNDKQVLSDIGFEQRKISGSGRGGEFCISNESAEVLIQASEYWDCRPFTGKKAE